MILLSDLIQASGSEAIGVHFGDATAPEATDDLWITDAGEIRVRTGSSDWRRVDYKTSSTGSVTGTSPISFDSTFTVQSQLIKSPISTFSRTLTGDTTLQPEFLALTGDHRGHEGYALVIIKQDGTGGHTLTWDPAFATTIGDVTVESGANAVTTYSLTWDFGTSRWITTKTGPVSASGGSGRTFYDVTDTNTVNVTALDALVIAEGGSTVNLPDASGAASIQIVDPDFRKTGAWGASNVVTVNANSGRLIGTGQNGQAGDAVLELNSDSGPVWLTTSDTGTTDWVVQFQV